jgi:hypothetical protein
MRTLSQSVFRVAVLAGSIACSSSTPLRPIDASGIGDSAEATADASTDEASLPDRASSDADAAAVGCNQVSDCPAAGGGACANACSDGTNPCASACVAHACSERGCLDASLISGQAWCNQVADCPPNGGASCAHVCADGTNPCENACSGHQCVERGCPDGGFAGDGGDAGDGA